jgi:hypothetical protein
VGKVSTTADGLQEVPENEADNFFIGLFQCNARRNIRMATGYPEISFG